MFVNVLNLLKNRRKKTYICWVHSTLIHVLSRYIRYICCVYSTVSYHIVSRLSVYSTTANASAICEGQRDSLDFMSFRVAPSLSLFSFFLDSHLAWPGVYINHTLFIFVCIVFGRVPMNRGTKQPKKQRRQQLQQQKTINDEWQAKIYSWRQQKSSNSDGSSSGRRKRKRENSREKKEIMNFVVFCFFSFYYEQIEQHQQCSRAPVNARQ